MLVVKVDGLVDGSVGDGIAVSQVLRDDARARFIFLRNIRAVCISSCDGGLRGFGGDVVDAGSGGDVNLRGTKLSVIEEKSGFGSAATSVNKLADKTDEWLCLRFFLEGNRC